MSMTTRLSSLRAHTRKPLPSLPPVRGLSSPPVAACVYRVSVIEGDSSLPSLLSLAYSDGDVRAENRDSYITIITVTGYNDTHQIPLGSGEPTLVVT